MCEVYRVCKRLTIKLLEFVYNSNYVLIAFLLIYAVLFITIKNSLIYNIFSIIYNVIILLYIAGWVYDGYKKDKRIKQLEEQFNNELVLSKDLIREDLADLMHDIWCSDMQYTNISSNSERDRLNTLYKDLPEFDKLVNRNKADKIITVLEDYKVL